MALNKNLIEPLLEWNFISVIKQGAHHMVALTNKGRNALRFLNVE
jgi:predicted transcriptional regulator